MLALPLTSDPCRTFTTDFDSGKYTLTTKWNERSGSWTIDVLRDKDQAQLLVGVPVLLGQDILAPYTLNIGGLIAADQAQTETDPGPDDLGDRVRLIYAAQAELGVLAAFGTPGISVHDGDPGTPLFVNGKPSTAVQSGLLVDMDRHVTSSNVDANEHVVSEFEVDLTGHLAVVNFHCAFLARATNISYVRIRLGGAAYTADGQILAEVMPADFGNEEPMSIAASFPNPGKTWVKVTAQSMEPLGEVSVASFSGVIT